MYSIFYTETARTDLKKLDHQGARRIITKIAFYGKQKKPLEFAKPLKNMAQGTYRFRIGDYRAIFRLNKNGTLHILMILRIKHRKEIYNL